MSLRAWMFRLRSMFRKEQMERELDEKISSYPKMHIEDNLRTGMTREEAPCVALIKLGAIAQMKENYRDHSGVPPMETVLQNARVGVRTLLRKPGFALVSILVIAIGIGANVALFTVVRSVLLRPLPFKDPARLMRLYEHSADDKFPYNIVSGGVFSEWKKQSRSFSDMAILLDWPEYNLTAAGGELPERLHAAECSWNLFSMLGVEPALGRSFSAEDDQAGANATVMLSWGLWKRRFGGDPAILNRTIHLNSRPYTVIGVTPAWFTYPAQAVQLWTPVFHEQTAERMQPLDNHMFLAIGRLKDEVTEGQAAAELSLIVHNLQQQNLDNPFVSKAAHVKPLLEDVVGDLKGPLYMLLAATGCVLLIACLNVASLLVARAASRRREIAIRSALGSSQWRLLGDQLVESFLLSAAGGALGLLLAHATVHWLVSTRNDMSRVEMIQIDGVVIAFAAGLVFVCGVFSGLVSSVSSRSDKILSWLKEDSRSHTGGQTQTKLRKLLLSLEVGLTVILLITAGLLLKSYEQLRSANLGCITNNVLTMRISLPEQRYKQSAQLVSFFETMQERVRDLPGVLGAGFVNSAPGQGYNGDSGFTIAEHPPLPVGRSQYAIYRSADPGYFAALGIPVLRGGAFWANQRLDHAKVVIINDSFARQYFPGEEAVGKHLLSRGEKSYEIVGVVGDTRFVLAKPAQPIMYFPMYDGTENTVTLAVRGSADVSQLALPIQKIAQELDRDLPISDVLTMDQIIDKSTADASFDATLVLAFAVLSLVLAAVGLFGVLSCIVAQRTKEIGIRVALGAQREEVLVLVLLDGLGPVLMGLGLGVGGSIAAAQFIRSLLYGIGPLDPAVFLSVIAILVLVACAACLLPARRATRVDPMIALRYE